MDNIIDITARVLPSGVDLEKVDEEFQKHRQKLKLEAEARVARINTHRRTEEGQESLLKSAGVPARFLKARLTQFPRSIYSQFATRWAEGESGLIVGNTGTGKTHLAVAFMRDLIERSGAHAEWQEYDYKIVNPLTPKFITSPSLLVEIRGTFGKSEDTNTIIEKYMKAESLVLDDLGAEKTTDWSMEVLYLIIDSRYSQMKQLLVTSNLDIEEIATRLGDRIASRLSGLGFVMKLEGRDRRLTE